MALPLKPARLWFNLSQQPSHLAAIQLPQHVVLPRNLQFEDDPILSESALFRDIRSCLGQVGLIFYLAEHCLVLAAGQAPTHGMTTAAPQRTSLRDMARFWAPGRCSRYLQK